METKEKHATFEEAWNLAVKNERTLANFILQSEKDRLEMRAYMKDFTESIKANNLEIKERDEKSRLEMRAYMKDFTESIKANNLEIKERDEKNSQEMRAYMKDFTESIKDTDRKIEYAKADIAGITNSNGLVAEDFFFDYLYRTATFGNMHFERVERGTDRARRFPNGEKVRGQWDIVLINGESMAIIEVKYKAAKADVEKLAEKDPEIIRKLYPEFENRKLYLGMAGLSLDKSVESEALSRGIAILKQKGDAVEVFDRDLRVY